MKKILLLLLFVPTICGCNSHKVQLEEACVGFYMTKNLDHCPGYRKTDFSKQVLVGNFFDKEYNGINHKHCLIYVK